MQRSPAAGGDPFDELIGPGLAAVHRAEQAAVGGTRAASIHAVRAGRAADDIGSGAAGGCPRRRRREHHIDEDRGERQRDKHPGERRPVASVA